MENVKEEKLNKIIKRKRGMDISTKIALAYLAAVVLMAIGHFIYISVSRYFHG